MKLQSLYPVCPSILPEHQGAVLIVKGEEGDLYCAGAAVDGRGQPVHPACVVDQHVGVVRHVKLAVDAANDRRDKVLRLKSQLFSVLAQNRWNEL